MKSRSLRGIVLATGGALLFWLLPWFILKLAGYVFVVIPDAGDQSQTDVVDLGFRAPPPPLPSVAGGESRHNIIFLMADGLGFSQLYATRLATHGAHGRLLLERFPVTGWQTNPSIDDVYTDSAASASSLYTGFKTDTRALSIDSAGRPLTTLAEWLRSRGYAVGLITDSYLWDASIAAHASHQVERYHLDRVAEQLAASGFDLLVGTWPEDESIREPLSGGLSSLVEPFRQAGYRVLDPPAPDLPALDGHTVLLYPTNAIAGGRPPLSSLARWAVEQLSLDPRPFFLFVETEEPDTGSHRHDFGRIHRGLLELDAVAEAALDVVAGRDDTLILATGDHETGGFAILSGSSEEPLAVRWATTHHTSSPVPVLAWGAGAERFSGVMDNTEIAQRLRRLVEASDADRHQDAAEVSAPGEDEADAPSATVVPGLASGSHGS